MEDSLNYMNAVSEASQALNQVTALKEQASMQFQAKKEQLGQELEFPSELSIASAGGYIGKKVLGYVSEKFGSTISDTASKFGVSEETVGKALSGDISGALEQGTQEVSQAVEGVASNVIGQAESAIGGAINEAQDMVSGLAEEGAGILGRVSSSLENIGSINLPSISSETDIGNIYSQGLEDLRAQAGIDENMFREYTNVSLNDIRTPSFNNASQAGQEVEMTDFSTIGNSSAEVATTGAETVATTGGEVATSGAEAGGEALGATIAETTGEVAGAEATGAVLDATGVLAPLGALVGLIGGLVGFFEGHHKEEETMPTVPTPVLNPSAQFV